LPLSMLFEGLRCWISISQFHGLNCGYIVKRELLTRTARLGQDINVAEGFGVDLDGFVRARKGDIYVRIRSHEKVPKRFGKTLRCSGTTVDECVKLVTVADCGSDS